MSRRRIALATGGTVAVALAVSAALWGRHLDASARSVTEAPATLALSSPAPMCEDGSARAHTPAELREAIERARRRMAERGQQPGPGDVVVLDGRGYNYRRAPDPEALALPLPDVPTTR